jgi:hypothetical protein
LEELRKIMRNPNQGSEVRLESTYLVNCYEECVVYKTVLPTTNSIFSNRSLSLTRKLFSYLFLHFFLRQNLALFIYFYVNSITGLLRRVIVGDARDFSEVRAASIFRVSSPSLICILISLLSLRVILLHFSSPL